MDACARPQPDSTFEEDPHTVSKMVPRYPDLVDCIRRKALRFGDFQLASGVRSDYYLDGKMLSFDPEGITEVVNAILEEIGDVSCDAIGGMDMGATPIVAALALRSQQLGRPIPTFTVRKAGKAHGTRKRIEGPIPSAPCTVIIVDDVVTSGDSILQAIDAVEEQGCRVVLAISVVDREAGGRERLKDRGVPYRSLVSILELGIRDAIKRPRERKVGSG